MMVSMSAWFVQYATHALVCGVLYVSSKRTVDDMHRPEPQLGEIQVLQYVSTLGRKGLRIIGSVDSFLGWMVG